MLKKQTRIKVLKELCLHQSSLFGQGPHLNKATKKADRKHGHICLDLWAKSDGFCTEALPMHPALVVRLQGLRNTKVFGLPRRYPVWHVPGNTGNTIFFFALTA